LKNLELKILNFLRGFYFRK